MTDDEDSLLDRVYDPESMEDNDAKATTTTITAEPEMPSRESNASPDITDALDYDEDEDDGEVEDSEKEEEEQKEQEEPEEEDGEVKEEEEKEEGELEDGEIEDSDGGASGDDDDGGPSKRVPITAPSGTTARRPIEVGSSLNDNRISRPLQRGNLPPITRNVPYLPRREEKTGGGAWDNLLQDAKKVIHYHENPDAERETPSPDDSRAHIPSLFDIRTHKPPTKDLGPQCIYPSRYQNQQHPNQLNRMKRNSGGASSNNYPSSHKSGDSPIFAQRNRTNSQRQAPPPLIMKRVASKSPPARGISWSPVRYRVEEISSDSDEEAFKKRPPRVPTRMKKSSRGRSRSTSSLSSNSSKSTIPGVRSISSDSSDDSSSRRKRQRNHRRRSRTYSSSSDRDAKKRHKRKGSSRSRSRSPPPYPPGHKQMFQKKNHVTSLTTGDIHDYRIPKKGSSKSKNGKSSGAQPAFLAQRPSQSKKRKRSETPPSSSSKRRKEERKSRKRKEERAQTISESDSTSSSVSRDSRKSRKQQKSKRSRRSPSTGSSSGSASKSRSRSRSRSLSRTSRSSSSGSDSDSKLPQRYRQKRPTVEEEKISSDEEDDTTIRKTSPSPPPPAARRSPIRSSSSSSRSPPPSRSTSPEDPPPPPPPPEDGSVVDPDAPPPPPPPLSKSEARRQLKMRLKTLNTAIKLSPDSMQQEAPTA